MNTYELTIIVPTYNSKETIEKTFDSIKTQTIGFDKIELIFVDDKSQDDTLNFIKTFAKNYENVKYYETKENSGFAGMPRNIGLKNSNSEYVLFLDSDDKLLIDACEILLENIKKTNADIVIGAFINTYENFKHEFNPPLYSGNQEVFENVKELNLLNITPAISAKLFKNRLLIENNILFPEKIPGQDLVFLIKSILNSKKISVLNNKYIYYRVINKNSISRNITKNYLCGLLKTYNLSIGLFEKYSINIEIQKIIFNKHLNFLNLQVLRSLNLNTTNNREVHKIFNCEKFNEIKTKPVFQNDEYYEQILNNMQNGKFKENIEIFNLQKNSFNQNSINDYSNLKNTIFNLNKSINKLTKENEQLNDKISTLNEKNANLITENTDLKNKITEIKSNKLFKIIKKI